MKLPPGKTAVCAVTVTGPGGVLLKQEIPMRPGWGTDRAAPTPEPYFCGYVHSPGTLLPICYNPIANRVSGCVRPVTIPDGHLVTKAELTVRRSGELAPVASVPIRGRPDYRICFSDASFWRMGDTVPGHPPKPATVLEWVAPFAGTVKIDMEFSNQNGNAPTGWNIDGVALQVLHYDVARNKLTTLVPRLVTNDSKNWAPIAAKDFPVNPGDKVHFYFDRVIKQDYDGAHLRGTLTLTTANGDKTVYNPGGEFTPGKQGGTTGAWFYRWDNVDSKPNADGKYPELPWQKQYNHLRPAQQVLPEAFVAIDHNREQNFHQALIGQVIAGTDWVFDSEIGTLTPGVYEAAVTLYAADGRVLGRARQTFIRYDHAKDLPWLGNKVGVSDKVLPPWTPINGEKVRMVRMPRMVGSARGGYVFRCWGREYRVGGDGLLASIQTRAEMGLDQGARELLAGPMRFEMVQDGKPVVLEPAAAPSKVTVANHEASWRGAVTGNGWRIETAATMEYDGYVLHRLRITPPANKSKIDSLRLVIPLKPEYATHLHAPGSGNSFRATVATMALKDMTDKQSTYEFQKRGLLWDSQLSTSHEHDRPYNTLVNPTLNGNPYYLPYRGIRPYVWVGGDGRGLAFMADNDKGWVPDDPMGDPKFRGFAKTPPIEVVRGKTDDIAALNSTNSPAVGKNQANGTDCVALVLNLVARPFTFDKPREIVFSLQATPVRPAPPDIRARRQNLYMASAFPGLRPGGTGWSWTGQMYTIKDDVDPNQTGWLIFGHGSCPYPLNWDMSKWYQGQSDASLRGEGHFHMGSLARWVYTPYQAQHSVMTFPEVDDPRMPPGKQAGNVYGYISPHMSQGCLDGGNGNMAQVDVEYRLWCYRNWIKQVGLRGMYFDLSEPHMTANPAGGFGYVQELPDRPALDGKVQPGWGMTRIREFYKRLRTLFVENGETEPYIWVHSTDGNSVSAFAFIGFLLDGENNPRVTSTLPISKKIPPVRQQAMRCSAGGLGFTQLELVGTAWNAPEKPLVHRDITGWFMLHDVGQGGSFAGAYNWAGLDLNRRADFLPYWSPRVAGALKTTQPEIYASAWRQDNALRVLVYNRNDQPVDASIQVDLKALGLKVGAKPFTATELEPKAKPEERGAGDLKAKATGGKLTVTVPVQRRNFRLFRVGE